MNQILNFMDTIYSNKDAIKIVYIVGAILLFIFIVILIFSLRSSDHEKVETVKDKDNKENNKETIENTNIIDKDIEDKKEETIEDKVKKLEESTAPIPINIEIKKMNEEDKPTNTVLEKNNEVETTIETSFEKEDPTFESKEENLL